MLILALKTATDDADIFLLKDDRLLDDKHWPAGHQLSKELLEAITKLLTKNGYGPADLEGVVLFSGPGSFTGLRIGAAVANALAYASAIPIVGSGERDWLKAGVDKLLAGQGERQVVPHYDRHPNVTPPK